MNIKILFVILILISILVGCDNVDLSKVSDKDMDRVSDKLIKCNAPYIRFGAGCCLDQNKNSICDRDESTTTTNPKDNQIKDKTKFSDVNIDEQELCETSAGLDCMETPVADYYFETIKFPIKNTMGYEIKQLELKHSSNCKFLSIDSDNLPNGAIMTVTLNRCKLTANQPYTEEGEISYRNAETGQEHNSQYRLIGIARTNEKVREINELYKCEFVAGLDCTETPDANVAGQTITFPMVNSLGYKIHMISTVLSDGVGVTACTGTIWEPVTATTTGVLNGDSIIITMTGCTGMTAGERFSADVTITYTSNQTGMTHSSVGRIGGIAH